MNESGYVSALGPVRSGTAIKRTISEWPIYTVTSRTQDNSDDSVHHYYV